MSVLTIRPEASPGTDSVDGVVGHWIVSQGDTWTNMHDNPGGQWGGPGNSGTFYPQPSDTRVYNVVRIYAHGVPNRWCCIQNSIMTFAIPSIYSISAAYLQLYCYSKINDFATEFNMNVYSATPISNIATDYADDYHNIGTTAYCNTPTSYEDMIVDGWNTLPLNATGLSDLVSAVGGVFKLGIRNANYDVADAHPPWALSYPAGYFFFRSADYSEDYAPRLVITYGTVPTVPSTTTNAATAVGSGVGTPNGTLDADGGEACDCGFEWGETTDYEETPTSTQSRETGQTFSQELTALTPDTTYHFRAIATNSAGSGYGADDTFTTDAVDPTIVVPTVTSDKPTVAQQQATIIGTLISCGGEDCDFCFEWGRTNAYGTTEELGAATPDTYSEQISGLIPNTEYHFRACARNSAGTGYGVDVKFITEQRPEVNFRPVENRAYALARWEI